MTDEEYEHLMKLKKHFVTIEPVELGPAPLRWNRKIKATGSKEDFMLDFYRGKLELKRYTYNHRFRTTNILLRYDSGGRHTNPDGVEFNGPHVHVYREGYNDKFAFPIDHIGVDEKDEMEYVLVKFLDFCNIQVPPTVNHPMF